MGQFSLNGIVLEQNHDETARRVLHMTRLAGQFDFWIIETVTRIYWHKASSALCVLLVGLTRVKLYMDDL